MRSYHRLLLGLLCLTGVCGNAQGAAKTAQNLFFLTGKDAASNEGDMYHRAVYFLEVPETVTEKLYVRIFDADLAGAYDRWEPGAEVRYRVYGKGAVAWALRQLTDPLPSSSPLADLRLGENKAYDDQWRTLAALDPAAGEPKGASRYFQLLVDGVQGKAINKYQVFVSALEKENKPVTGLRMFSPVVMLYLPINPGMATQLQFDVPPAAQTLEIFNFDADLIQTQATLHFEAQFTMNTPIASSKDGQITSTKITLAPEQRGKTGALVLRNPKLANNTQLWINDDQGQPVPIFLPAFTGPDNHLPLPKFSVTALSECFSVLLDASASTDSDNDELAFEWLFPDGTHTPGSRIVHNFERAGAYPVTLVVRDHSGFVANSSRFTETIRLNEPPTAVIKTAAKAIPRETIAFDAAGSSDADGVILKYLWNFGDGVKEEGQTVKHAYVQAGKYQVALLVEDNSQSVCNQARVTHEIWVNAPPVPQLNLSKTIAAVDEPLTLDANGSIDSDGEIVEYCWDFGDHAAASPTVGRDSPTVGRDCNPALPGITGENPADIGAQVTHQWSAPGTYTVRLRVTDDAGLSNSSVEEQAPIVINAPPVPRAKYREVIAAQEDVLFDGATSSDPDGVIRKYVWDMGDGAFEEGAQIQHAYAAPGVYTVKLTVTDNTDTANNTTAATFPIRVNQPSVPAAGADQVVNASLVNFDASDSTDADDPISDYLWDFGDGIQQHGKTASHVYALPGTYTATLTVTDASGTRTASQSATAQITVNHPPIADAGGAQVVTPGANVALDGSFSADPDGQIVAYTWEVAQGSVFDGARVEHQYQQPGKYQARLTVTDNIGAESTDYAAITVNAPPVADFYPIPRVAPGQTVKFDGVWAHDPDGKISRAVWDFGDQTPAAEGLTTQHSFSTPGRYSVTLTVQDDSNAANNTAARTRIVAVNYGPQAEAGADIHTCSQNVAFDASKSTDPDGDALNYFWDFGDGARGEGRKLAHTYVKPGIYPVQLTVNDGQNVSNSIAHATLTAYVNASPIAKLQINSPSVCAGELVLFDAGQSSDLEKGRLRYVWDLGDGKPIEGINPVREYTEGGDYRIRLTVTDDSGLPCDTSVTETMLHVIDAPIARAGAAQTVCANTLAQLDGSASTGGGRRIKSYEWEFGDGQLGVGVNPGHVYAREGDYTARLLITVAGDGQCSDVSESEVAIHVMAAPVAAFQAQKAACAGEALAFDASASTASNGNITAFAWDFGDGDTAAGKTASQAYQTPGTYRATLKITTDAAGTCNLSEAAETITINAVPAPVIQVTVADQPPFSGQTYATERQTVLRFSGAASSDADGFIKSYKWDFGDGQQSAGPFAAHQYDAPGDYPVTLRVQDNSDTACHANTATLLVRVREPNRQAIRGPDQVCVGQPVTYTAPEGESAEWIVNDGATATGREFQKTFKLPGKYQLQAKMGADWLPVKAVTALELPDLRLPERLDVFPGDVIELQPLGTQAASLPLLFQWDLGDGTRLNTERLKYSYAKPGEYALQLLMTMQNGPECLQAAATLPVTVHAPPQVEIRTAPEQIFTGGARDAVTFQAVTQGEAAQWNYAWDFGDGEKAVGQRVSHAYRKRGTFQVTVTLSDSLLRTSQTYVFSKQIEVKAR